MIDGPEEHFGLYFGLYMVPLIWIAVAAFAAVQTTGPWHDFVTVEYHNVSSLDQSDPKLVRYCPYVRPHLLPLHNGRADAQLCRSRALSPIILPPSPSFLP